VSSDQEHVALPLLYGAPAHGVRRGARMVDPPLGRDDLPIECYRSPEEHELALQLYPRSYGAAPADQRSRPEPPPNRVAEGEPELRGKPLLLRALAGVLMRPKGD
jgi:hypothetical protein